MKHLFFLSIFSLILYSCDATDNKPANNDAQTYTHSILNFGTVIDVTVTGVDQSVAQQAFDTLDKDFKYWHTAWNPWLKGPLSRVNLLIPTKAGFNLPLHLIPLIKQSQQLHQQSEGLFNPAIGQLINLWKFHEYKNSDKQPPDEEQIKKLVAAHPGMDNLSLKGIQLQSNNEQVLLNFGAFAKGYAIERSIKTLHNFGIKNAVINAGGDLKVAGQHKDRPWRIGIRDPRNKNNVIASIQASDNESVFTSGDYERFFVYNGRRYHHILDPRTGYPADLSQSVTVIHDNAGLADAAATALFVAGPDHWHRIAKKMKIKYVMLIAANGDIHLSPAMADRIQLHNTQNTSVKISETL